MMGVTSHESAAVTLEAFNSSFLTAAFPLVVLAQINGVQLVPK